VNVEGDDTSYLNVKIGAIVGLEEEQKTNHQTPRLSQLASGRCSRPSGWHVVCAIGVTILQNTMWTQKS